MIRISGEMVSLVVILFFGIIFSIFGIDRCKFGRNNHCLRWAALVFLVWVGYMRMTITS